jgi:hypothetical protein
MSGWGLKPRLCGVYYLEPDVRWNLYHVARRKDGQPVPDKLKGKYSSFDDFRRAAESVHGDAYSDKAISDQQKIIFDRMNEARKRGETYEL